MNRRIVAVLAALSIASLGTLIPAGKVSAAPAQLLTCRFGPAQVFDVQWYISGGYLNASSFTYPAYGVSLSRLNGTTFTTNDYLQFFPSITAGHTDTYGLKIVRSDNTEQVLDEWGTFRALGDDFIFYNGYGNWGTVFTTTQGYAHGSSASLPVTVDNPTMAQVNAFTSCSSNVAAAGQPVSSASPTPSPSATSSPSASPSDTSSSDSSGIVVAAAPSASPSPSPSLSAKASPKPTTKLAHTGNKPSPLLPVAMFSILFGYMAYSTGYAHKRRLAILKWLGLEKMNFDFKM